MDEQEIDVIRQQIIKQGAVINPPDPTLKEIIWILFLKTVFAVPGAGVYYTDETNVYRLELDERYKKYGKSDYETGLPMWDKRIEYIRHENRLDRVYVFFSITREAGL